jgi:hypothetical protein
MRLGNRFKSVMTKTKTRVPKYLAGVFVVQPEKRRVMLVDVENVLYMPWTLTWSPCYLRRNRWMWTWASERFRSRSDDPWSSPYFMVA